MRVKRYFKQQMKQKKVTRTLFYSVLASILVAISLLLSSGDANACASCGCTLSNDWENLQFSSTSGLKIDLSYNYIDQDQLRSGVKPISPAAASQIVVNGSSKEVEKYTINNYVNLGIDYSVSRDWGINVVVPYIDRKHSTLGTASDGSTGGPGGGQYDSHTDSFGDVKIIGRYQGFTHNAGLAFSMDSSCRLGAILTQETRLIRPRLVQSRLTAACNRGPAPLM